MKTICSLSLAVLLIFVCVAASGSDKKQALPQSNLKFLILKDDNGKPVRNAAIVLHPVAQGKQEKGGFELKADHDGKAESDGIPYGPLRVQVIADGFQTFGQDYTISQPETNIEIRLKRPKDQYTVYGDHSGSNNPPK